MKRILSSLLVSVVALGFTAANPARAADPKPTVNWSENYKAALDTAKKDKKLVVLDFTGSDWCGFCIKLHKAVFSTPTFATWSKDKVMVELDYPHSTPQADDIKTQNAELQKTYKINGFPTVIILNSDGKEIARSVGYNGDATDKYIASLNEQIKAKSK